MKTRWLLSMALFLPLAAHAETAPQTEEQRTLYLYGVTFGKSLKTMHLGQDELEFIESGMRDGFEGKKLKVDAEEGSNPMEKLNEIIKTRSKEKTREFLSEQKNAPGATIYPSGLIMTEIEPGSGASPKADQTVKVHYHGTLPDGSVFDSSVDRGEPAEFPLNRVIPCWTEGVQKMKKGGKSRLVCPPDIAYGDRGSPGRIPPGTALLFEVELIDVAPDAAATP